MPHTIEQAEAVMKIVNASADAIKILSGVNGEAASRLARVAAEEVEQVVKGIAKRQTQARRARARRR